MFRKLKNRNRFAGFTITEVVMASVLLLIAIVPILKALTIAHVSTTAIERKTRCLILAQAKLDEIKARLICNYLKKFTEVHTSLDGLYLCRVVDMPKGQNLRVIVVAVGYDQNGNGLLDLQGEGAIINPGSDYDIFTPGEVEVTLATFIARRR